MSLKNDDGRKIMAKKNQSLINGAIVLSLAIIAVKIIGVFFKIYVTYKIGMEGKSYYATAYNLYTPVYSIALAGLPTAVAKMVAAKAAQGRYRDVKKLFSVSILLFSFLGAVGSAVIILIAVPFASSVSHGALNAVPAILAIAPSLFFCCVMSGYRGYYQGLGNMNPSAVSQVFEAGGKLVFGWIFINFVIGTGAAFADKIPYLRDVVTDTRQAWAAAAAIAGVTVGSLVALIYLIIRHSFDKTSVTETEISASPLAQTGSELAKQLIALAVPIAVSSLIFNVTTLIDNWVIPNRLMYVLNTDFDTVAAMYPGIVEARNFTRETAVSFKEYLYGAYDTVLEIKNIVPTFTVTFGLSVIPVLTNAWVNRDNGAVSRSIQSVIRMTLLFAFPAGCGMFALAPDILELIYGRSPVNAPALPYIAPVLMMYGVSVFFLALTQPITNMLQVVDRTDVPIKAMALGAAVKILANYVFVSIPSVNIQGAAIGSILCNVVMVVYGLASLSSTAGVKYEWTKTFLKPLFCGVLSGAAAWAVNGIYERFIPERGLGGFFSSDNIAVLAGVFAAVVCYALSLFATRSLSKEEIIMLPKGRKIVKVLEKYGLIG